ncbi:WLM domain-containing protein [Chytriomyces cf. hyalinus JEL632]|nr:WLM domain-containing protein [Chytriomyces cf. hyalinus JEL632]
MGLSDDTAAMKMLRRVASLVSPLMTKRAWVLPLLREFVPDNANLLGVNVNRGQEIRLRLRPSHSLDTFYDLDFVLGTMLHELTHNIRGPHDAEFYRNLDMLSKEHDDNVSGGWTGAGFDSAGTRLGGGVRKVDEGEARAIALRAALEREKKGRIMIPAGGRKLGGSLAGKEKTMSPGEMAAMAAERRLKDRVWCGSKGDGGHSHVHVISDDDGDSDSEDDVAIRKGKNAGPSTASISGEPISKPQSSDATKQADKVLSTKAPSSLESANHWECQACSWPLNNASQANCEACLLPKTQDTKQLPGPSSSSASSASSASSSASRKTNSHPPTDTWTCETCSLDNAIDSSICAACERPSPSLLAALTW